MIEILSRSHDNVVAVRIDGKLVHADYQEFLPKLEEILKKYSTMRCYCEMTNFEGLTPQALLDEVSFDVKHCNDIERCAVVGAKSAHEWMGKMASIIFTKSEIRFFKEEDKEEAWEWASADVPMPACGVCGGCHTSKDHG